MQHISGTHDVIRAPTPKAGKSVLIIGGTGVTGRSAIHGLQQTTLQDPEHKVRLTALTRNPSSPAAVALRARGVDTVVGDLDSQKSLKEVLVGVDMVYCHALSNDAARADPAELARARLLAQAITGTDVQLIIYNSAGGYGCGYGISQMDQKHQVEDVLRASGPPLTALRATMFMEEFWKRYTRPPIINKGTFPFSQAPDKPLQLLAARDMGLVAGHVLSDPDTWAGQALELAGDELTPLQMCDLFTQFQPPGHPTPVRQQRFPALLAWFINRDLYRIIRFLNEKGYSANVHGLRQQFPGLMTFSEFLKATHWQDASRSYEQGVMYEGMAQVKEAA